MQSLKIIPVILLLAVSYTAPAGAQPEPGSEQDENSRKMRQLIEDGFNTGDTAVVDEIVASHYVSHANGNDAFSSDAVKRSIANNHALYDNYKIDIKDLFASGDKVVFRYVCSCKHIETDQDIKYNGIFIGRFDDGLLEEGWNTFNTCNNSP